MNADARRHFRVHYPSALRPRIELGRGALEVIDLSECGLRCTGAIAGLDVGAAVATLLSFRHGRSTRVEGQVVRLGAREVALQLRLGPSFQLMLGEQRAVMGARRYSAG